MEIGESIAVSAASESTHFKQSCPFCKEGDDGGRKQDLVNDPSKLRTACNAEDVLGTAEPIGRNAWLVIYEHPQTSAQSISEVRSNPHHLIPGGASLKGHPILEAVEKDKGTITGDIGYDVNGKPNGIWLPTILQDFYWKNPATTIRWGRLTTQFPAEQFDLAEAAMFETSRQFHDAHEDYSAEVKLRLDALFESLRYSKMVCPEAGPKPKPNVPPPFGLVGKMDALSSRLAGKLVGSPLRWKRPLYTSRHAIQFADKLRLAVKPPGP